MKDIIVSHFCLAPEFSVDATRSALLSWACLLLMKISMEVGKTQGIIYEARVASYHEMQEVIWHGSCPTKPNLTTPEIVEQFPCRTLSVSNTFLRPHITGQ